MLHFGMKPPFTFEKFIAFCRGLIPESDIEMINSSTVSYREGLLADSGITTLKKWHNFEKALRNELVKIRASRKHIDPVKYLRGDGYAEPYIAHIALNAYRNPSILEAERSLDQERWRFLDELLGGHYFDLDCLIVYALKLLLLERWGRIK